MEVICHHSLLGKPLVGNMVILAACNPYLKHNKTIHMKTLRIVKDLTQARYKRRVKRAIKAGCEGKIRDDELSALVYR